MDNTQLKKGMKIYYARILPTVNIYDVCELILRTIKETYFVGVDKRDKHAYLFSHKDINKTVFINRNDALEKVLIAEENKPMETKEPEKYYEEY